jgi:hypothetical protein
MSKFESIGLFPQPIIKTNIGREWTEKEKDFISYHSENTYNNMGNTTSNDRYVLNAPEAKGFSDLISEGIKEYVEKVICPKHPLEFYVTQSWLNFTKTGQYHHTHEHPNSIISGVLYIDADEEKDKIFNNTYGDQNVNEEPISFNVAPSYIDDMDHDDRIHYDILIEKIDEIIKGSQFEHLNKVTQSGVIKKLNKVQINEVFFYVIERLGSSYTRVDLFSVVSDYFDIFPNKFYNSLSNKFKDELIKELDDKYNILEKRKIRKLF